MAGDACSLVEAFRAWEISPLEALDDCIAAIRRSPLNAFSFTDFDRAREAAASADVSLPFGGVPFGVKELEKVAGWPLLGGIGHLQGIGWPATTTPRWSACGPPAPCWPPRRRRPSSVASTATYSVLHGTTRNPWNQERTPGGSSGGTAAAVVGGLLPIATGSDGGGSIRGPAGFSGLFGLKATYGRIPKGPDGTIEPMTTVRGCLTRSVRDTARFFDACNGFDQRDPLSLPKVHGWEAGLGSHDLSGMTAAIVVDLGIAQVRDEVAGVVASAAAQLAKAAGLRVVEVVPALPPLRGAWAMANQPPMVVDLDDAYPDRVDELSPEVLMGLRSAQERYTLERAAAIERYRRQLNGAMADLFDEADFVLCSTHPDVAFKAEGPPPSTLPGRDLIHEIGFTRAIMNNAGAHRTLEPQRQPRHEHPGRLGRWLTRRTAGAGGPPPRGAAARPCARGGARDALAVGGARARRIRGSTRGQCFVSAAAPRRHVEAGVPRRHAGDRCLVPVGVTRERHAQQRELTRRRASARTWRARARSRWNGQDW